MKEPMLIIMGRYNDLLSNAIAQFARENPAAVAIGLKDLVQRYNPEIRMQGAGQALKYQRNEINELLKEANIRILSYGWDARRRKLMITIERLALKGTRTGRLHALSGETIPSIAISSSRTEASPV